MWRARGRDLGRDVAGRGGTEVVAGGCRTAAAGGSAGCGGYSAAGCASAALRRRASPTGHLASVAAARRADFSQPQRAGCRNYRAHATAGCSGSAKKATATTCPPCGADAVRVGGAGRAGARHTLGHRPAVSNLARRVRRRDGIGSTLLAPRPRRRQTDLVRFFRLIRTYRPLGVGLSPVRLRSVSGPSDHEKREDG